MRHDPHRVPGPQTYLGRRNKKTHRDAALSDGKSRLDLRVDKNPHGTLAPTTYPRRFRCYKVRIARGDSPSDRARPLQQNISVERHYPTAKAASPCLCAAKNPPANKVAGTNNTSYPRTNRCDTIRTGYPALKPIWAVAIKNPSRCGAIRRQKPA